MSTLESTISILEVLPEADLLEVQQFAKKLFSLIRQRLHSTMPLITSFDVDGIYHDSQDYENIAR